MARVSMYGIKTASRTKRDGWEKTNNKQIVAAANEVVAKAKNIPDELMDLWDKESIKLTAELADKDSLEELRRQIARIMELAGEHYGISKELFWKRHHAQQKAKRDE